MEDFRLNDAPDSFNFEVYELFRVRLLLQVKLNTFWKGREVYLAYLTFYFATHRAQLN